MSNFSWSKINFRALLPDVVAIVCFVALATAYFRTPLSEGLVLQGHDHGAAMGVGHEMEEYAKQHDGERTRWTNVLFGGMPTYQMSPSYPSTDTLTAAENVYKLWLPDYVVLVYVMLLGFYIMLRAFDFRVWMSALGAIVWAFSSYYFIIIGAGHIWKFYTLAFIPPTIAGLVLCYRGRYGWGLFTTAFFMALQLHSNHIQMSYYFGFVIGLMALAYCPWRQANKRAWFGWAKSTAVFALGCIFAVLINVSNLYHTWQYSKESMRGQSELTQKAEGNENSTDTGLDRSYITNYSYEKAETWTFLIPNVKGGASIPLSANKDLMSQVDKANKDNQLHNFAHNVMTQYWGGREGTSGPVYVGAFVFMLFILGLFIVKGPMKWALFIATLFSVMLAWGRNYQSLTDIFIDYVPFYSSLRAVESILVVAEFTIPLLAIMTVKRLVDEPDYFSKQTGSVKNWWFLYISLALTAGVCLISCVAPHLLWGSCIADWDYEVLQGRFLDALQRQEELKDEIPQYMAMLDLEKESILTEVGEMRASLIASDALRSLIIIAVGTASLLAFHFRKIKAWGLATCLIILCTVDLWDVNKRYLNDESFVKPRTMAKIFPMSEADKQILQDPDPYYRVFNLNTMQIGGPFNENNTSFYHKSIGGYHAAKLRRYQELIERYIQKEIEPLYRAVLATNGQIWQLENDNLTPVLNMLNMKYAILPITEDGQLISNIYANGNAWFVDSVITVKTADEELEKLGDINTKTTAVINTEQFPFDTGCVKKHDRGNGNLTRYDDILLTKYEANQLDFVCESKTGGLAVFSDIYYPGWTCTVDGQPVDIVRANYVLRAVVLPAGKHNVQFRFDPKSIDTTETIAYSALIALLLLLLALIGTSIYRQMRRTE